MEKNPDTSDIEKQQQNSNTSITVKTNEPLRWKSWIFHIIFHLLAWITLIIQHHLPMPAKLVLSFVGITFISGFGGDATENIGDKYPKIAAPLNYTLGNMPELVLEIVGIVTKQISFTRITMVGAFVSNQVLAGAAIMCAGADVTFTDDDMEMIWAFRKNEYVSSAFYLIMFIISDKNVNHQDRDIIIRVLAAFMIAMYSFDFIKLGLNRLIRLCGFGKTRANTIIPAPSHEDLKKEFKFASATSLASFERNSKHSANDENGASITEIPISTTNIEIEVDSKLTRFLKRIEKVQQSTVYNVLALMYAVVIVEFLTDLIIGVIAGFSLLVQIFVGYFIESHLGNGVEFASAIKEAMRGNIGLSLDIALGSAKQIKQLIFPIGMLWSPDLAYFTPLHIIIMFMMHVPLELLLWRIQATRKIVKWHGVVLVISYGLTGIVLKYVA